MVEDRWQRLQELFGAASRLPAEERAGYLERRCDGDAALRTEVESLLRADEVSSGLFLAPVAGVAASLAADLPHAGHGPSDSAAADGEPSLVGKRIGAYQLDGGTTEDGVPYVVMERVEGEALDRYCDVRSALHHRSAATVPGPVCGRAVCPQPSRGSPRHQARQRARRPGASGRPLRRRSAHGPARARRNRHEPRG